MATYNLQINTDVGIREDGLQHVVALHNQAVAARNASLPEGATPEAELDATSYLQLALNSAIDSYASAFSARTAETLKEKFEAADEATKDAVLSALQIEKTETVKVITATK